MQVIPITKDDARKLLGDHDSRLTDEEIEHILTFLRAVCDEAIEQTVCKAKIQMP